MKPRILGIETEYGLTAKLGPSWGLTSEAAFGVIRHLFETTDLRNTNSFLENGARLYLDGGDHPEYATPECDDVMELVAHDKAGERILEERLRRAEQRLGEEGTPVSIRLFKNNTDSAGNYYGCHENYLVKRDVEFAHLSTALVPFLVTRQVFAGAGKAYQTCGGSQYCLSQRGQRPVFESAATPYFVIDTRDEPLADPTRYRRLHVVVGDANMSEVATYLKVGTTALLLDMVEDGVFGPDLTLQSATNAIHDISGDPTLRKTVTRQDGRRFTALELQMEYLEQATRYVASIGASAKARELLCRWTDVLSKLAADPMQLERQVDWVTKWALIERFIGRHQLSWQDPKVGLLDLQYHDLRREEGIYARLVSRGAVDRMVDDHAVVRAQRNPPRTTRARLRGDFIRNANLSGSKYRVNWTYLRLAEDPEQQAVSCSDPFRAFDERVESLVRRMHLKADLPEVEGPRDGEPALAALPERADRRGQTDEGARRTVGRGTSGAYEPLRVAAAGAGGPPAPTSSRPSAKVWRSQSRRSSLGRNPGSDPSASRVPRHRAGPPERRRRRPPAQAAPARSGTLDHVKPTSRTGRSGRLRDASQKRSKQPRATKGLEGST